MQAALAVSAAIAAFVVPSTHKIVPKPGRATSEVWKYGVKLMTTASGKMSFACFGNPVCRERSSKGVFVGLSRDALSNATDHIKEKHKAGNLIYVARKVVGCSFACVRVSFVWPVIPPFLGSVPLVEKRLLGETSYLVD